MGLTNAFREEDLEPFLDEFNNGNEQAFRFFYEQHYNSLCVFAARMLHDDIVAADCVQEVFVSLWKARKNISSHLHLRMYLYQALRHRCISYIKQQKLDALFHTEYALLSSEGSFEDQVVEAEVFRLITEEISRLPDEQRKVIMFHLAGNSNPEIAKEMNISINTVKTHKARARKSLKTKIDDLFILFVLCGL